MAVFSFFDCQQIGSHMVVAAKPAADCHSQDYQHWAIFYWTMLIAVVAFPVFVGASVRYQRRQTVSLGTRYVLGPLFEPFSDGAWFWVAVMLFRRLVFLALSTTSSRLWPTLPTRRILVIGAVTPLFLCLHLVFRPFKKTDDNFADALSILSINVISGLFVYHSLVQGQPEDSTVPSVIIAAVAVPFLVFAFLIIRDVIRNRQQKGLGSTAAPAPASMLSDADRADVREDGAMSMDEAANPCPDTDLRAPLLSINSDS